MANRDLFYFYAPTWDYPPEGPIKLGNVISSVKKPHIPLIHSPPTEETGVFKTEKKKAQYTTEKLRSGKFSILTKFLSVLGFGVDISAEVERMLVLYLCRRIDELTTSVMREYSSLRPWRPLSLFQRQNISRIVSNLGMFANG